MKLGEIKLEALKLMFANYNEDLGIEQLVGLTHSQEYGHYLIAMPGSINRCFADLESRRVLPTRSFTLPGGTDGTGGRPQRWELSAVIPDYLLPERLIYERDGVLWEETDIAPYMEGNTLRLPPFDGEREQYRVLYRPRLERILPYTKNSAELSVPDYIAQWIPYWIKGELFREDEPNEAGEARNWYEAAMSRAGNLAAVRPGAVRSVYSMTEV